MKKLPSAGQLSRAVNEAAVSDQVSVRRMRRWIAAIALIEVFSIARAGGVIPGFVVKGGFALEFRFRGEARASRDIDIVLPLERDALMDAAIEALRLEWSGFTFRIKGTPILRDHSFRFEVNALYENKDWSTFDVELVFGHIGVDEGVKPLDLAAFGLMQPGEIPCMTVMEQIAQKLHAVSDPKENRPRDLIDIYLLDTRLSPSDDELRRECLETFHRRATHPWPPNIMLKDGWDVQLDEIITRSKLPLSIDEILRGVRGLVARLLGLEMPNNLRYHFIVLDALPTVPNLLQSAVAHNEAYTVFTRMTEQEGWRLAHILPYPSREATRAILAVLEQAIEADEGQRADPPRLELSLHTGTSRPNEYALLGEIRNVGPEAALGVSISVSGIDAPATVGTLAREDGPRSVTMNLENQRARTEALPEPIARVRFSDRYGRTWEQTLMLQSQTDASNRYSYQGNGLGQPQRAS